MVALVAAACRGAGATPLPAPEPAPALRIRETPSPYSVITAGPVRALVPDDWRPLPADGWGPAQRGIYASPRPRAWGRMDGSVEGLAAVWVDATEVGVPSDYYYLAATGVALARLTASDTCHAELHRVIVDHRPARFAGEPGSPGDYVATGRGVCVARGVPTRFAYFVAAPGYGPVRAVGIPSSGLYVVVAVVPDSGRAARVLGRLLQGARFGGAGVDDLIAAARERG